MANRMVRVQIYYDSKYGNTKLAAGKIAQGLKDRGIEADLTYVKEARLTGAVCADLILLGAPNHMGRPSMTMKRFVEYLSTVEFKATKAAVFGTYSGRLRTVERAVKKLELMVQEKLPNLKLLVPGLSVRVNGVKGPVVDGELLRCVVFGWEIANQLGA